MTTLLGKPVHQLVNANIESTNNVAATQCINVCSQRVQQFFWRNVRMGGQKCDINDFDHGMIVDARQGGLNISETDLLGFWHTTVSGVCRTKNIQWAAVLSQKCFVNERSQRRRNRQVKDHMKVTVMQITTHYNSGMQKSISEHTTLLTSKWIGDSNRKPISLNNKPNTYLINCSLSVVIPNNRQMAVQQEKISQPYRIQQFYGRHDR